MRATQFVTGIVLIGMMATPAVAQERRRERAPERNEQRGSERQRDRRGAATGRAVPREAARPSPPPASQGRRDESPNVGRNDQGRPGNGNARNGRSYDNRSYDNRRNDNRGYDDYRRGSGRTYYPYYSNRGYGQRTIIVPRYIRPSFVTVVPYRPYYYRPSIGVGIYYGSGGYYPYGYTPRGYYDPIPGRPYGGLRITGFSRDAQVFADGYYVGIVNDFDGIFQAVNLEAGAHRIEIVEYGREAVAFDVMIQPGRTMTFRADGYRY